MINYCCVVDGKPAFDAPSNAVFVGMEVNPNSEPRYGKLVHPWTNLPCYETPEFQSKGTPMLAAAPTPDQNPICSASDIEAIRVRHGQEGRGEYFATIDMNGADGRLDWVRFNKHEMPLVHQDRAALLAEVERLKERHKQAIQEEVTAWNATATVWANRAEAAEKEVERLRAANESAAVCAEHIPEFTSDGCLVCDLNAAEKEVERLRGRLDPHMDPDTGCMIDRIDLAEFREAVAIQDRQKAESRLTRLLEGLIRFNALYRGKHSPNFDDQLKALIKEARSDD